MSRGYVHFFGGGETRAYATCNTPSAILQGLLKALELHGVSREQIEASVDLAKMQAAFDAIDQKAFRKILNASPYHGLQIVLVEASEKYPPGSMAATADQGTLLGAVGF
jgi:hypothetical protein